MDATKNVFTNSAPIPFGLLQILEERDLRFVLVRVPDISDRCRWVCRIEQWVYPKEDDPWSYEDETLVSVSSVSASDAIHSAYRALLDLDAKRSADNA